MTYSSIPQSHLGIPLSELHDFGEDIRMAFCSESPPEVSRAVIVFGGAKSCMLLYKIYCIVLPLSSILQGRLMYILVYILIC